MPANYDILEAHRHTTALNALVIIDVGPHDRYLTVTNAADEVVRQLHDRGVLGDKRLFYIDSMGALDEIKHAGRLFLGFAAGPEGRAP